MMNAKVYDRRHWPVRRMGNILREPVGDVVQVRWLTGNARDGRGSYEMLRPEDLLPVNKVSGGKNLSPQNSGGED